ncbi:MAG: hypothetical protein ACFUZC_12430 [Chthoniobacteraceae bacterium]
MMGVKQRTKVAASRYRPDIVLATSPQACAPDSPLKVWILTGRRDLLMALWALKSLIWSSKRNWDVWIADDGTLDASSRGLLMSHLCGAHILESDEMTASTMAGLVEYPKCRALRNEYILARKLFDPYFAIRSGRYLIMDSDILFFGDPCEIVDTLLEPQKQPNCFCRQAGVLSLFTPVEAKSLIHREVMEDCNSGLSVINKESIDLPLIERALSETEALSGWRHILEQSIYALLSSRYGYRFLSPAYQVHMGSAKAPSEVICTHYVATMRDQFYAQGVRYFQERWQLFGMK